MGGSGDNGDAGNDDGDHNGDNCGVGGGEGEGDDDGAGEGDGRRDDGTGGGDGDDCRAVPADTVAQQQRDVGDDGDNDGDDDDDDDGSGSSDGNSCDDIRSVPNSSSHMAHSAASQVRAMAHEACASCVRVAPAVDGAGSPGGHSGARRSRPAMAACDEGDMLRRVRACALGKPTCIGTLFAQNLHPERAYAELVCPGVTYSVVWDRCTAHRCLNWATSLAVAGSRFCWGPL